ncbi:MAG: SAM-dependent methyltransferase [Acidimicrobiales bacterium]|nr:SAM-dependent methyltransferase [Acidimicrobiales bacterium]MCB1260731.1 SAM-dependent methyltransferase [Acidimicrobiales bacterium]
MASVPEVPAELAARIERFGSVRFDEYQDLALYGPDGFYERGGRAGRRGDFLTSPETGPLFGALVARYLDEVWRDLGEPDPFTVLDVGAGPGTLAKAVERAAPACSGALTYVLVERSAAQRALHPRHLALTAPEQAFPPEHDDGEDVPGVAAPDRGRGPRLVSLAELPQVPVRGVVFANELLDNVATRLLQRAPDGWDEVRVTLVDGVPSEVLVPADDAASAWADRTVGDDVGSGARLPYQEGAARWLRHALELLQAGRVLVVDYTATTPALAQRPVGQWLRTYRGHARGGSPLDAPGQQDLTVEVCADQLAAVRAPHRTTTQAAWLAGLGIDSLVEDGRRIWHERAHIGDLAAVAARSRVGEAEALLDTDGLGAFGVLEWRV